MVETIREGAQIIRPGSADPGGEIAPSDGLSSGNHFSQRRDHPAHQEQSNDDGGDRHKKRNDANRPEKIEGKLALSVKKGLVKNQIGHDLAPHRDREAGFADFWGILGADQRGLGAGMIEHHPAGFVHNQRFLPETVVIGSVIGRD
jgi:hypothetical protein